MANEKYPGKRYHATEAPRYVQNADEDKALGKGWFDSPKKVDAKPAKQDKE